MKFIGFLTLLLITGFKVNAEDPPPDSAPSAPETKTETRTAPPNEIDLITEENMKMYSRSYMDAENALPGLEEIYCNPTVTMDHTRFMLTNYRALFTFMNEVQKQSTIGKEPKHGSVVFLNWQDQAMKMKIPQGCQDSNSLNLYVYFGVDKGGSKKSKYEEIRNGLMKDFNEEYKESKNREELHMKTFSQRNYFRTVTLKTDKSKLHHFNIFTRPLGYTTFPVPTYVDEFKEINEIKCEMKKIKELIEENELGVDTSPFQFFWKFPAPGDNAVPSSEGAVPIADVLYWENLKVGGGENQWNRTKPCKGKCDVGKISSKNECGDKAQVSTLWVRSKHEDSDPVAEEEYGLTSGRLSCITMDRFGLTSAFWWEDFDYKHSAPQDAPFRGFANNRTRTIWPLITLCIIMAVMLALTFVLIFFGKQWNEDRTGNATNPKDTAPPPPTSPENAASPATTPKKGSETEVKKTK